MSEQKQSNELDKSVIKRLATQTGFTLKHETDEGPDLKPYVYDFARAIQRASQPDITEMVNRFLGWRLPEDFYPDCFVNFESERAKRRGSWPMGTNLFHAGQAKAMIEHMLAGALEANADSDQVVDESVAATAMRAGASRLAPTDTKDCVRYLFSTIQLLTFADLLTRHDANQREFDSERLHRVANLVGIDSAIPKGDLSGCVGAVLGMVAKRIEEQRELIKNLAAIVRVQNGNLYDDINKLLAKAEEATS